ncbi:hypothetical protein L209DRAFT_433618 [Thermothelomyces heterothallicus CBS 203.75]
MPARQTFFFFPSLTGIRSTTENGSSGAPSSSVGHLQDLELPINLAAGYNLGRAVWDSRILPYCSVKHWCTPR